MLNFYQWRQREIGNTLYSDLDKTLEERKKNHQRNPEFVEGYEEYKEQFCSMDWILSSYEEDGILK